MVIGPTRLGIVLVMVHAGISGAAAARDTPTSPPPFASNPVSAPAAVESRSERRAVRGSPVDDGVETPELSELRRFEEHAFPRGGAAPSDTTADSDAVGESGTAPSAPSGAGLPGRWAGTGDVPEPLRSPGTTLVPGRQLPAPDSDWLRALTLPDIPVRWDPQVLRYLDYFRNDTRGRAIMSFWLRRAGRFRALFEAALERQGLPKDLFYVAMVESGFETGARSRVGAGGVWQFMPGAARAYGLEVGYWVDARRDPERSVEAAARYLKDLYVRFGSWHLVFAAYNAGYGAVLKSITRYNTNDYWELTRHEAGLPWESSVYVPKILAAAVVGRNAEAFGFRNVIPDPPFAYEDVEVAAGTPLASVARAARTSPEVLTALNPHLIRDRTPPDRGASRVRLPVGAAGVFAEAAARSTGDQLGRGALANGTGDRLETVTLRFGETLDQVAKGRGASVRELKRLNGVKDTSELRAGVTILVPRRKIETPDDRTAATAPQPESGAAGATPGGRAAGPGSGASEDDEILVAVPDRTFNYEGRERVFYRTRDADTVEEISEAFGVRPDDLLDWNNVDASARLHPGMVLQLFVRKDFDSARVVLLDPARVRVVTLGSKDFLELETARRGKKRLVIEVKATDTLAKIGRRYGLTPGDLARINRFSYNTELRDGQKVVVYSPVGETQREVVQGLTPELRRAHGPGQGATGVGSRGRAPPTTTRAKVPPLKSQAATPAAGGRAVASRTTGQATPRAPTAKPAGQSSSTAARPSTSPKRK